MDGMYLTALSWRRTIGASWLGGRARRRNAPSTRPHFACQTRPSRSPSRAPCLALAPRPRPRRPTGRRWRPARAGGAGRGVGEGPVTPQSPRPTWLSQSAPFPWSLPRHERRCADRGGFFSDSLHPRAVWPGTVPDLPKIRPGRSRHEDSRCPTLPGRGQRALYVPRRPVTAQAWPSLRLTAGTGSSLERIGGAYAELLAGAVRGRDRDGRGLRVCGATPGALRRRPQWPRTGGRRPTRFAAAARRR
jgi:hypothetical protein